VIAALQDASSPEYTFFSRLISSIIITNLIAILIITIALSIFIRKTIYPVNEITNKIKNFNSSKKAQYDIEEMSYYNKKDEI
jgi:hypothetical protein